MNSGVPWQKGVRREVIDTAREAARRSGMSVEEWLDTVISESARNAGIEPASAPRQFPESDHRPAQNESAGPRAWRRGLADYDNRTRAEPSFLEVNARLAALSRQIDHLAQTSEVQTRQQAHNRSIGADDTPDLINDAFSRLDRKIDRLFEDGRSANSENQRRVGAIDRAVAGVDRHAPAAAWSSQAATVDQALAEIEAAQRMLEGGPAGAPMDLPRAPTQRLPDLEHQLRQLNARIETMRPCGIDAAVETLRDDLAEIGMMLKEAMPRQAIEALESEIRSLAARLDNERRADADGVTIAGVERGLVEVRDALHALAPAESLVGFEHAVHGLSQKIDRIAGAGQDLDTLKQLENAITALRGVVSHVASNDTLAQLSDEVRTLSSKVDQVTSSGAFSAIEQRITAIADALQHSRTAPSGDTAGLETVVRSLADKIDQLHATHSDQTAVNYLEDRIVRLVEKLDASDSRLDHLGAIERGLADLLIQMEGQRLSAERGGIDNAVADAIKRDVQRTQDSLETVHGTLGHVVDRLATIEAGIRETPAPRAANLAAHAPMPELATPPVGASTAIAPMSSEPAPGLQDIALSPPVAPAQPAMFQEPPVVDTPAAPRANPTPASDRRPIDPDLPPDHPLEPGAGRSRGSSPAERIAASEAALENVRPPVIPDPAGKSNFIAAARRAAQAAIVEAPPPREKRTPEPAGAGVDKSQTGKRGGQARKLMVVAAIIVLALGALHFVTTRFWFGATPAAEQATQTTHEEIPVAEPPRVTPPPASDRQSSALPPGIPVTPNAFSMAPNAFGIDPSPLASAPNTEHAAGAFLHQPVPQADVMPSAGPALLPQTPPAPAARGTGSDRLPSGIGSSSLRAAAANGDAAAEFEIATRFAEGRGVPQNLSEAAAWFERAAGKGLVPAQFRLGGLYEKGMGVRKDLDAARRLYVTAAEAGHAKAMHNLAVLYAEGVEGKPNYGTAARWFRKAADHGVTDSQYNLAILYARGIGVEANMAEAFKWFALASREGDRDAAKKRDDVAGRLDKQSLAAAMAAAQSWQAQPQPGAAINVKTPPGGWDGVAPPTAAKRNVGPKADAQSRRSAQ
jgi:localization factor PodJL